MYHHLLFAAKDVPDMFSLTCLLVPYMLLIGIAMKKNHGICYVIKSLRACIFIFDSMFSYLCGFSTETIVNEFLQLKTSYLRQFDH